jgi:hypothetical protein
MARKITISLSDELEARIEAEAKARGVQSIDEYAAMLLSEGLARVPRVPSDPRALAAELLKGLEGPEWTPTREEWERKKAAMLARHARSRAG